jgi:hypothetical protein
MQKSVLLVAIQKETNRPSEASRREESEPINLSNNKRFGQLTFDKSNRISKQASRISISPC